MPVLMWVVNLLTVHRKAALIGLAIAIAILIGMRVNQWRSDSAKLDDLINQVAATNALNAKTSTIEKNLDTNLNQYRSKARELDKEPRDDVVIPSPSLQRIRRRIEAANSLGSE